MGRARPLCANASFGDVFPSSCCRRCSSRAPHHFATTTVATPLPTRLVSARASDINRSMPRISATRRDRQCPHGRQRRGQHDEAAAGHAAAPLEVSSSTPSSVSWSRGHRRVGRLCDEHGRHRQINRRAVEVERVAGRDHQSDDRLGGAGALHLGHHARQHRLRRGRAEHDEQLVANVAHEPADAEAVHAAIGPSTKKMKNRQVA